MSLTHSQLLLRTICDLIPDPALAARIRKMDPSDEATFAEAYCAVRELATFTPALRKRVVEQICALADAETERLLRERRAGRLGGSSRRLRMVPQLRLVRQER
jgi:hypothetical protein